jgi:TPR repeat protein
MRVLAAMLDGGLGGVRPDPAMAAQLMKQAAELGDGDAMFSMGVYYATGHVGVTKDEKTAAQWFQKAAQAGHAQGMYNLAIYLLNGTAGMPKDQPAALDWLRKAAVKGSKEAQELLTRNNLTWDTAAAPSSPPSP